MTRISVSAPGPARGNAIDTTASAGTAFHALARASDTTLAEQLTRRYDERIRQRLLAPGRAPAVGARMRAAATG